MTEQEMSEAIVRGQSLVEMYRDEVSETSPDGSLVLTRYLERVWKEHYFVLQVRDAEGHVVAYSHSREPDPYAEAEFLSDFIGGRDVPAEGDLD